MRLPEFTPTDIEEARRLNGKLNKMPRLRMQTTIGRAVLQLGLWLVELYPLIWGLPKGVQRELRTVEALSRRVKIRVFRPQGKCLGIVLHMHGGGWTIGNARMADSENARLAARIGVAVVSVDYRLALAAPVLSLSDDCEAAAVWTIDHALHEFGTDKVVVKATSAGAHLAALTLLRLRDRHATSDKVVGAALYFGLYDFSGTPMVRRAGPETLILHGPTVRSTLAALTPGLTDEERRDPSLSPLYADLHSLPPSLFVVGMEDMLLEDSMRMAARWQAASGNALLLVAPDSPHAFDRFGTAIARKIDAFVNDWMIERLR